VHRALSAAAQKRINVHTPNGQPSSPTNLTPGQGVLSTSNKVNTPTTGAKATPSGRFNFRNTPGGRKPTTPYGKRAQQLNDKSKRYAGATPGPERRKSGKMYRETPRNDLRALSRVMAPKTVPVTTSPSSPPLRTRRSRSRQVEDDSPPPPPPRLSMPRHELDYDSFHEAPPRMSVDLDGDEVEEGRRQYQRRKSSFGAQRLDDQMGVLNELDEDDHFQGVVDNLIIDVLGDDEDEDDDEADEYTGPIGDNTTVNLRAMIRDEADGDISLGGRQSFGTDGEPTFQFNVPEGDWSRLSQSFERQQDEEAARTGALSFADIEVADDQEDYDATGLQFNDESMLPIMDDVFDDVEETNLDVQQPSATPSPRPISSPHSIARAAASLAQRQTTRQPRLKTTHVSKHGIEYPSLPSNVVKKLASTFSRQSGGNGKVNKETLTALTEASDWFFERMSEDLATYSTHAKRKRIEDADVVTLMKRYVSLASIYSRIHSLTFISRQRLVNDHHTVFSLAQKYLPGELLQAVRMAPPVIKSRGKKRRLSAIQEE
jgi:histone H3/H4